MTNYKLGTLTNPPFSMCLGWPTWSDTNHSPFIDWLKVGSEYSASGDTYMEWAELEANGHITSDGVINSVPAGADNIVMFVLGYIPAYTGLSGRYRLYYSGNGSIYLNGPSNVDASVSGQIDFDYVADGDSAVAIVVTAVTTPIRLIAVVHHNDIVAYENGDVFRAEWLDVIRNNRMLRFNDWMAVDWSQGTCEWSNRYSPGRVTYQGREGVPVEVMCDLCNLVGADPWFCLQSPASDAYAENFATLVRTRLDPKRHVYVELSNKVWDSSNWVTATYFRNLAEQWFSDTSVEACMEAYGGRSAEIFQVWQAEWTGAGALRLHTVLQPWTAVPYHSSYMLDAPRWVALQAGRQAPWHYTTEYALHANLDGGLRYDWTTGTVDTIQGWIDTLTTEQVYDNMAAACRTPVSGIGEGYTISGLLGCYEEHSALLKNYPGVNVVCYEGGTHIAVPPVKASDVQWRTIYNDFHRSPQWASVFSDGIDLWYSVFQSPSNVFNRICDIRRPDQNNSVGLLWYVGDTVGNLQLDVWNTQQNTRQGRGAEDFIGPFDLEISPI